MDFLASLDWTALSSQFTAVCIAGYGLFKAVAKFVSLLRR